MGEGPPRRLVSGPFRSPPDCAPLREASMENATVEKRTVRKIRYRDSEWELIVARARECRKPPARYVREVSLGFILRAKRNRIEDRLIVQLGRVGNNLNQLARLAQSTGQLPTRDQLHATLEEILAAIRRIG